MLVAHMCSAVGVYTQRAAWLEALGYDDEALLEGPEAMPTRPGCCGAAARCEEVTEQAVLV